MKFCLRRLVPAGFPEHVGKKRKTAMRLRMLSGRMSIAERQIITACTNYIGLDLFFHGSKTVWHMLGEKGRTYQRLEEKLQLSRRAERMEGGRENCCTFRYRTGKALTAGRYIPRKSPNSKY